MQYHQTLYILILLVVYRIQIILIYIEHSIEPWTGMTFGLTISAVWYWCSDQMIGKNIHAYEDSRKLVFSFEFELNTH